MDFKTFLQNNIVVFDGAFGTLLQQKIQSVPTIPERLNLENPAAIEEIHREYAEAGADVITANTFGANEGKVGDRAESETLVHAAVRLAKKAAPTKFVALDIGPTGRLLEPMGTMSFAEAYDIFAHMVEAGSDADLILIETMSDLQELRAALLAAKEHSNLPVVCSMTFEENGRTFTGCDPVCYALTASPLADAVGVNCSLGPDKLLPVVELILAHTAKPVIVQANAGMPDAEMRYSIDADRFAETYEKFLKMGVRIVGGCCGTTPAYIKKIRALADSHTVVPTHFHPLAAVCSANRAVFLDDVHIIGERINPTGKKAMKQALLSEDYAYVQKQAIEQQEAGASILDVNAGLPELDEKTVLPRLIREVQAVSDLPIQIDSSSPAAIEAALRACCGKAIVNSVNGEDKSLHAILPLVKKYGAAVVGLTVDEHGVPKSAKERIKIAEKIIRTAEIYGIAQEDIFIDCLTLTVSAEQAQAAETLSAIREIKARFHVKAVLGVSNISFGLPNRQIINSAFLTAALFAGLDLPILNPNIPENIQTVFAFRALSGRDKNCAAYTERFAAAAPSVSSPSAPNPYAKPEEEIFFAIRKGLPDADKICAALLERFAPLEVIDRFLIPALNEVGNDYEKGILFLPQLIAAAESAKGCFAQIKQKLPAGNAERGKIVLATVKGDVHDIGKNIAKTVLENYGYTVIDLGKNVPPEMIVMTCRKENIRLCGLSALMTTTVPAMEETIRLIRAECPDCRVMVGGAVLSEEYAKKIGADWYCKDANADVKIAQFVFEQGEPVPTLLKA